MARILLDKVGLTFTVRQNMRVTLKEFVVKGLFRRKANPSMTVQALKDVTFTLSDGDRLGIIGGNGAGKSTLLRVLAGIYPPNQGRIEVTGAISSLFDIALGFEPEATGWENICYRGYLQGETPTTIKPKMNPIAEFSELGHFLDMPVRYYSAGMKVRLAFSIATAIDPEVLLVDEVLSVGDRSFVEKAAQRMRDMMAKAKLMVFVSHDLDAVQKICDRVMWLDHGQMRQIGKPDAVIAAYMRAMESGAAQAA